MPKQNENKQNGNRATRRLNGARLNARTWAMHAAIADEIAPRLAEIRLADELTGFSGHYAPENDVADWPRSKEFGEASEGGEVRQTCGRGYYPAHVAHGGEGRGGADMASENSPILAGALAIADEKAITAAYSEN